MNIDIKKEVSLRNCVELKKMIVENPDLPLVVFTKTEDYLDWGYSYAQTDVSCEIGELTIYIDKNEDKYWLTKDEYKEVLQMEYEDDESLYKLSDEEFFTKIDEDTEKADWIKAIVIWN